MCVVIRKFTFIFVICLIKIMFSLTDLGLQVSEFFETATLSTTRGQKPQAIQKTLFSWCTIEVFQWTGG